MSTGPIVVPGFPSVDGSSPSFFDKQLLLCIADISPLEHLSQPMGVGSVSKDTTVAIEV